MTTQSPTIENRCAIQDMPLEIMEMIFGEVKLTDLLNLLSTSKWIKTAFSTSKYCDKFKIIIKYQSVSLKWILRQMQSNPCGGWNVHGFLTAYTDQRCECGEYGWYMMWLNDPPKKLCEGCLDKPEYRVIRLKAAMTHYGLKPRDIKGIPIIRAQGPDRKLLWDCRITTAALCVQEIALHAVLKRKGINIATIEPYHEPEWEERVNITWLYRGQVFPGTIRVPLYDVRMGYACQTLRCQWCQWNFNDNHIWEDYEAAEAMRTQNYMLYTYETLKDHVTSFHPQLLDNFIQGWESIGSIKQLNWLAHRISTPEKEGIGNCNDYYDRWTGWHRVESDGCNFNCQRHKQ